MKSELNIRKTRGGVWPKPNQTWTEIYSEVGRKKSKAYQEQYAQSNYDPSWWFHRPIVKTDVVDPISRIMYQDSIDNQ